MSVICQNFVQNAWKKDLCSNCFKSLSDHELEPTLVHPCIVESPRNGLGPQINARYVSQATTIYHSRGFLNHAAWKSLISDRQDGGNGYLFKLENGFHSKLLSISANDLDKNCQNGNKVFTSIMKTTTTKRQQISTKMSLSVGFKEEDPLVIGYGGNDYDSDEHDWEMGSDDGDFPLGSLDVTPEDRAITKITKENTEFNSKNDNLLKGCVASCFTNGVLPNGSVGQHTTEGSPTVERVKNKDDDVRGKVEKSLQQTENSGRKLLNGISSSQCLRKEFPPRASVRPILREPATVKGHQGDKVSCEPVNSSDVRTEINSPRNSTLLSDAEPCEDAILDEVGIIHESVIVLVDSNSCPAEMNNSEMSEPSDPNVTARTSFLHGMSQEESPCSAIYTPGNNDLFVSKTSSSSSDEPTDESDSGSDHPQMQQFETTVTSEIEKLNIGHEQKTPINASVKPPKPARNTIAKKEDPPSVSETTSFVLDNEVTVISNKSESPTADRSIYYAVSNPLGQYNAENNIYQEVGKQSGDRVSKLAALAQELEQARCPGSSKRQAPAPPKPAEQLNGSSSGPPSLSPIENVNHFKEPTSSTKIYGFPFELKTKSATMSSVQGKKVLAILNFDDNGNTSSTPNNNKGKKGKFSIKKFLKRGKDMESIDQIFQNHNTPNPKAWKQADFDRSKLRLEILHPMDLANKNELQSSSTEESSHETSSFTDSDTNQDGIGTAEEIQRSDGIYDDEFTWHNSPDNSQLVTQSCWQMPKINKQSSVLTCNSLFLACIRRNRYDCYSIINFQE